MSKENKNLNEVENSALNIADVSKCEGNSVKATVCPECGCNKLQHDYVKHYTCLNVLCDWQGQTGC
jgi:hypothetical protein